MAGALLDAIEAVRTEFPDTCDLYIGDFSMTSGGSANHHRSHQNGRDVDIGMYAKGNRRLDGFMAMNEDNLDAAKTWCLIDNIIRSQRVQYIFLDRRVQQVLYNYAVSRGYDQAYLDRVFGNVRGSLIQHVRNHYDHIHVRFFTPWSTLAAHIGDGEAEKRMVIEMAQQSYLPKKVNYYVNGNDSSLDALAQSFGVTKRDLCKWNKLNPSAVPVPGSCLVFYKRSFESEPVHLARSLQPGFIAARGPSVRMASLRPEVPEPSVKDSTARVEEPKVQEEKVELAERSESSATSHGTVYRIKRGDTVKSVARRNNMEVKLLCSLNGIKETTPLRPGRTLKTSSRQMLADAGQTTSDAPRKSSSSSSAICFSSDSKKPNSPTAAYYTVGKGETLQKISRKSGISIDVLCQLNGLKRGSGLKPGQKIKLTQANLPVKPSLGSSACAVKPSSGSKAPAVKGNAVQKTKGAQSAKADKKSVVKSAQAKPGQKPTAKQAAAVSKPAAKSAAKAKADVKATSKKAVEAKKPAVKSAPAEAKKKGASQSAAVKPAQKNSSQPVNLAKNSSVKK